MIKKFKHISFILCLLTSLLAVSFIGCTQPTLPQTKYKVTFDNNGHGVQPSSIEVLENTILTKDQLKPLTTKDDFTFGGWFDGEKKAEPGVYKVTKDVTLKAEWTAWEKVSEVSFNINNIDVDYNDEVILTCATPDAIIHYSFDNQEDKICSSGDAINITGSKITAYATKDKMLKSNTTTANYTIKTYTVTFAANGHGTAPAAIPNLKKGDKVTKPTDLTTKDEFNFIGWYTDIECTKPWDFTTNTVSSNMTLYAKWKAWDKVNDVTFSINNNQEVNYNDEVILTCATPDAIIHYSFDNQEIKTCSSGDAINITGSKITAYATKDKMLKSNTTTANYTIKTYTVTFAANGHGTAPAAIPNLKKGDKVTKPTDLTEYGYIFNGWYKENKPWDFDNDTVSSDITLYANWKEIIVGDIILNDGTYVPNSSITEEQKTKAIAVVCGKNTNGKILGLGLKQLEPYLVWAKRDTLAYNEIKDIICNPSKDGFGAAKDATFTGDTDGSDNWDAILKLYNNDKTKALEDCPLFKAALDYGNTYNLPEEYKTGWFIPSISELTINIFRNKTQLNNALSILGNQNATLLSDEWYGSSSTNNELNYHVLQMEYGNLNIAEKHDPSYYNLVIRIF